MPVSSLRHANVGVNSTGMALWATEALTAVERKFKQCQIDETTLPWKLPGSPNKQELASCVVPMTAPLKIEKVVSTDH